MATRRPTAPRSTRRTTGAAGRSAAPRAGAGRGPTASRPARATGAARASTRPAAAARGRSAATMSAAERRRTRGPRVLVLSALVLVLAIFLVPSFQKWLEQRSDIGRLDARIAQQREDLAAAQAQLARWDDDDYVMTQARSRLLYVLPGEVPYVVDGASDADAVAPQVAAAAVPKSSAAWYDDIWESLRIAGNPDVATVPGTPLGSTPGSPSTGR